MHIIETQCILTQVGVLPCHSAYKLTLMLGSMLDMFLYVVWSPRHASSHTFLLVAPLEMGCYRLCVSIFHLCPSEVFLSGTHWFSAATTNSYKALDNSMDFITDLPVVQLYLQNMDGGREVLEDRLFGFSAWITLCSPTGQKVLP